jgi:hypothetical protein
LRRQQLGADPNGKHHQRQRHPLSTLCSSSLQINFGVQREIVRGGVLSVDYIHSATEHIGQVIDTNHVGAACYFNPAAAQAAVAATLAAGSDC